MLALIIIPCSCRWGPSAAHHSGAHRSLWLFLNLVTYVKLMTLFISLSLDFTSFFWESSSQFLAKFVTVKNEWISILKIRCNKIQWSQHTGMSLPSSCPSPGDFAVVMRCFYMWPSIGQCYLGHSNTHCLFIFGRRWGSSQDWEGGMLGGRGQ